MASKSNSLFWQHMHKLVLMPYDPKSIDIYLLQKTHCSSQLFLLLCGSTYLSYIEKCGQTASEMADYYRNLCFKKGNTKFREAH